jgi:hypothetical protein
MEAIYLLAVSGSSLGRLKTPESNLRTGILSRLQSKNAGEGCRDDTIEKTILRVRAHAIKVAAARPVICFDIRICILQD